MLGVAIELTPLYCVCVCVCAAVNSVGRSIIFKQLKIEGFNVTRWLTRWPEAFKELGVWLQEVWVMLCVVLCCLLRFVLCCHVSMAECILHTQGKLKYEETVTNGFENMFDAFAGLFKGDNLGKAVVKA